VTRCVRDRVYPERVAKAVSREQVLGFRVRAQQLDRTAGRLAGTALLDIGVQDTGPDGGLWALAIRGVDVSALPGDQLTLLWTIRGAPHYYRRADLSRVAAEVAPFSDEDAGKRIFDASKPLKAAGIPNLAALDTVAKAMRSVVVEPTVKGEVSTRLTRLLDQPYLRFCQRCDATHVYEQPFRLAALRAGLELVPDTSPPVLRRIPGFKPVRSSRAADLVRSYLRLLGPATPKHVADYLDAPLTDVRSAWPSDVAEVTVDGQQRWLLDADRARLAAGPVKAVRLLGPFDLFLQAKDRSLLVDDPARSKELWPAFGRPGAVLVDGAIAGSWRPRAAGGRLRVLVRPWTELPRGTRTAIGEQAERLAAYRSVKLSGVDY
jgi:winged helix DNA-binding protein